jgi:hypothetical protein
LIDTIAVDHGLDDDIQFAFATGDAYEGFYAWHLIEYLTGAVVGGEDALECFGLVGGQGFKLGIFQ